MDDVEERFNGLISDLRRSPHSFDRCFVVWWYAHAVVAVVAAVFNHDSFVAGATRGIYQAEATRVIISALLGYRFRVHQMRAWLLLAGALGVAEHTDTWFEFALVLLFEVAMLYLSWLAVHPPVVVRAVDPVVVACPDGRYVRYTLLASRILEDDQMLHRAIHQFHYDSLKWVLGRRKFRRNVMIQRRRFYHHWTVRQRLRLADSESFATGAFAYDSLHAAGSVQEGLYAGGMSDAQERHIRRGAITTGALIFMVDVNGEPF